MKILIALILLAVPWPARSQSAPGERQGAREIAGQEVDVQNLPALASPSIDSILVRLAVIEIAKAEVSVRSTDFWHRLIPQVTIGGGLGMRDIAFAETGSTVVFPRDSYRISVALSLSGLLDGTEHALAELRQCESREHFSLLEGRRLVARRILEQKIKDLSEELTAARDVLAVHQSLLSYHELLFTQGKSDFQTLARERIDLILARHSAAGIESRLHEVREALRSESPR